MALKTPHFKFLDIRSYLAPNYSYDALLKHTNAHYPKDFFHTII